MSGPAEPEPEPEPTPVPENEPEPAEKYVGVMLRVQPAWRDAVQDAARQAECRSVTQFIDRAVAFYCREVVGYDKVIPPYRHGRDD